MSVKKQQDEKSECSGFSRRQFLKSGGAIGASLAISGLFEGCESARIDAGSKGPQPRAGKSNLFVEGSRPLLVAVEGTDIEKMLVKGLETIGGFGKLVAAGDSVFIKPNYGSHRAYPTGSDPHFLVSIAGHAKKEKAGRVTICDSSDPYVLNRYNDFEYVFKANNVFEIGKAAGVDVICTHPSDKAQYVTVCSDRWQKNPQIRVNPLLLGAGVIINQPMLKKHNDAFMTCALKNFFGAVEASQRLAAHEQLKESGEEGKDFFNKTVAEFADCIRPELTIVDARKILTVKGPSLKEGSVVKDVNKIIISGDMVAADAYCAKILDAQDETFSAEQIVPTLQYAEKLGLGTSDLSKVKVIEIAV